jgi:hypothetical protein
MKKTSVAAALTAVVLLLSPIEASARINDSLYTSWASSLPSAASSSEQYTVGDFTYTISLSGYAALSGCTASGSVAVPSAVTVNGATYTVRGIAEGAFAGSGATSVALPDTVTYADDGAFAGCPAVKTITASDNFVFAGRAAFDGTAWYASLSEEYATLGRVLVKYNGGAAASVPDGVICVSGFAFSSVESVVLPDSVRTIADGAFEECGSLRAVTVPDGVTYIGKGAFFGCTSLADVSIPKTVSVIGAAAFLGSPWYASLDEEYCTVGDGVLLKYCGGENAVVPEGVKYISDAFAYGAVVSVVLPDSLISVGGGAFAYCTALRSVVLPGAVVEIGDCAFMGCESLTLVRLSRALRVIGDRAFAGCSSLRQLVFSGDAPSVGENAFPASSPVVVYYDTHSEGFTSGKWEDVPSVQIAAAEYLSGDADGNGRLTMRDVLITKQYTVRIVKSPIYPGIDGDGSGSVDAKDVRFIKRSILNNARVG